MSLQVLRDALDAITLLSTHPRSPHLRPVSDNPSDVHFNEDLEQLWKVTGTLEGGGERRPNMQICCDLLLDPTKPWLADFSSKSDLAFPIGVLAYEKDIKSRIAKLAYDIMLFACRLKKTPNVLLQAHNPFNIRKIWEMVVAQKSKNYYFTVFVVRVIREVLQECAAKCAQLPDHASSPHLAPPQLETEVLSEVPSASSRNSISYRPVPHHRSAIFLPGSSVITAAAIIMDCSLQDLSMYMTPPLKISPLLCTKLRHCTGT